jgi:formyltetrahydrofolate deformylase
MQKNTFYDAANYDHYAVEADRIEGKKLVLGAIEHQHREGASCGDPLSDLEPSDVLYHAATSSSGWRAQMTASQLQTLRHTLLNRGIRLLALRVAEVDARPLRIALFGTRQVESPRAILQWCKENPEKAQVCAVISTNTSLEPLAKAYDVPFFVGAEQRLHARDFFPSIGIAPDLIVLARYMRILPPEMVQRHPHRIINVHHALLPAFVGANTYERALERGVRIMGATAHYVTEELDAGPIICQQAFDIDPGMSLDALKAHGAVFEARALRNAVAAHIEHRLLVVGQHVLRFGQAATAESNQGLHLFN